MSIKFIDSTKDAKAVFSVKDNTLDAVFSLPAEMFYPGASVCACCMLFTLGQPHVKPDGTVRSTFFGYCKDDGFVKRKNLGRVEQFDADGNSKWKAIEEEVYEKIHGKELRIILDDDPNFYYLGFVEVAKWEPGHTSVSVTITADVEPHKRRLHGEGVKL